MMALLRNMFVSLVCLSISVGLLTACGTPTSASSLLSPDTIAQRVGTYYQDPHPHISSVRSTQTDGSSPQPMYIMLITGHFQEGKLAATSIGFSALTNRMYVWFIHAYDQTGKEVWFDHELTSSLP